MRQLGLTPPEVPSPLNLFMNIPVLDGRRLDFLEPESKPGDTVPVLDGRRLDFLEPESKPGDTVTMRAEMDCVVAFSACPQDMLPINGKACTPTEAHFEIVG